MYTNANSILTKMDELKDLVTKNKYHIIGITESWARNEIDDSVIIDIGADAQQDDCINALSHM